MDKTWIKELAEEPTPLGGMARTLVNRADLRLVVLRVPAGEQVAEHSVPVEVVFIVLAGQGTIYAAGEAVSVAAGAMVSCPAGVKRELAAGKSDLELMVIRAPNP